MVKHTYSRWGRQRWTGSNTWVKELNNYVGLWWQYGNHKAVQQVGAFESGKRWLTVRLYSQRGKWSRPFMHLGMVSLSILGLFLAPVLASGYSALFEQSVQWRPQQVVLAAESVMQVKTQISDKPRDRIIEYTVQPGDTLSDIATRFGISIDTIRWENNLSTVNRIKPGQKLRILPVDGVRHVVKRGETVYSIAKKYKTDPQAIVDFPFNSFLNDETFALTTGQELIVPGGVITPPKKKSQPARSAPAVRVTPNQPPTNLAKGQFIWPAGGRITQGYYWYHRAVDIANRAAPDVVAADAGRVVVAGWPDRSGYGRRVMIDHGNGYITLYAHLQKTYVNAGDYVQKGQAIGKMGSTGRSTGTHLHFEIRTSKGKLNPLRYLSR